MKIKKLPKHMMSAVVDTVINVPMEIEDIEKTVTSLPRLPDDAELLVENLKRKMSLKGSYAEAFISPPRVLAALKKLIDLGNPHYQNIKINGNFLKQFEEAGDECEGMEVDDPVNSDDEEEASTSLNAVKDHQSKQNSYTCLAPMDLEDQVVTNDTNETIIRKRSSTSRPFAIAPGENKLPRHWSSIKRVDEKAFPTLFPLGRNGVDEERDQKISSQDFNEHCLLNADPRYSKNIPFVFYTQHRNEHEKLENYIQIAGQRGKVSGRGNNVELKLNDVCNVFQQIKGTPKYWQTARNELIAKVKQLGSFHLFFTLSCGEMRWIEVYISVLKQKGHKVEIQTDSSGKWTGKDEDVLVEGQPLWDFVDGLGQRRQSLLKGNEVLITRHFDNRVKEFIKNIIMGHGKEKVKIANYNFRVEFQARGMPHIHGVLWIDQDWLRDKGVHGPLSENTWFIPQLADLTMSCSLPDDDDELKDIAFTVQRHTHTKSCRKKEKSCRYGFPRLPISKTVLAEPLNDNMDTDEKEETLKKAKDCLCNALEILEDPNIDENMSYEEYLDLLGETKENYEKYCAITERGRCLLIKRTVKERFVNSFNKEWIRAWNANMDLQVAIDTYAIISYIVNYVSKDESGMTEFLKEALAASYNAPQEEKMKVLKKAYLTHRQVGASEAVIRAVRSMRLKDSNIACKWVSSGFPENRYISFRKVKDENHDELDEGQSDEEEEVQEEYNPQAVKIKNKKGVFQQSISVHDKYSERPIILEDMCLAQFASCYTNTSKVPKKVEFNSDRSSATSSNQVIFGTDTQLPHYLKVDEGNYFRLREHPFVIRTHPPKRKEGHEQHFTLMQLFYKWRNETEDLFRHYPEKCIDLYKEHEQTILRNRSLMFPGEAAMDEMDTDISEMRPTTIYDTLNPQGEQEDEECKEEGIQDDPQFVAYDHQGNLDEPSALPDSYKYKSIEVPKKKELFSMTRMLGEEQALVLDEVLNHCKQVLRARKNLTEVPIPARILVLGGAGVGKSATIKIVAHHAENILRQAGSHPHKPRVLILGPTGKAASLIGEFSLIR